MDHTWFWSLAAILREFADVYHLVAAFSTFVFILAQKGLHLEHVLRQFVISGGCWAVELPWALVHAWILGVGSDCILACGSWWYVPRVIWDWSVLQGLGRNPSPFHEFTCLSSWLLIRLWPVLISWLWFNFCHSGCDSDCGFMTLSECAIRARKFIILDHKSLEIEILVQKVTQFERFHIFIIFADCQAFGLFPRK